MYFDINSDKYNENLLDLDIHIHGVDRCLESIVESYLKTMSDLNSRANNATLRSYSRILQEAVKDGEFNIKIIDWSNCNVKSLLDSNYNKIMGLLNEMSSLINSVSSNEEGIVNKLKAINSKLNECEKAPFISESNFYKSIGVQLVDVKAPSKETKAMLNSMKSNYKSIESLADSNNKKIDAKIKELQNSLSNMKGNNTKIKKNVFQKVNAVKELSKVLSNVIKVSKRYYNKIDQISDRYAYTIETLQNSIGK